MTTLERYTAHIAGITLRHYGVLFNEAPMNSDMVEGLPTREFNFEDGAVTAYADFETIA